jgi:N-acetylmuramoyl-L-alanine amidase
MTMQINHSYPSPNFDDRANQAVDMLVMHYTDMPSHKQALARLCDAQAKVSAHYLIAKNGEVFAMVDEAKRAWHAGVSHWRGHDNINARSIGIELCNPGHSGGYVDFPEAQMDALLALCKAILARHEIPARNVQGHSDIAFLRKQDPGECFNWAWLAQHGVGFFPRYAGRVPDIKPCLPGEKSDGVMRLQQSLASWGYGLKTDGFYADATTKCVIAFQRHYTPESISGCWDAHCAALLQALHEACENRC